MLTNPSQRNRAYALYIISILLLILMLGYTAPVTAESTIADSTTDCASFTRLLANMDGGVTDIANLLSIAQIQQLDRKIMLLEEQQGSQLAVLIVPTTQPLSIEQYAEQIFNQWRLGRLNIDDGVLLLVAIHDRSVRIEVGYGLEGQITDNQASQIINQYIIPEFRQNNYAQGIEYGVDILIAQIRQEPLPAQPLTSSFFQSFSQTASPVQSPTTSWLSNIIAILIIGGSFLAWGWVLYRLVKAFPLKVGIPLSGIMLLTWYCGGFNIQTWNGMEFGEAFLYTQLPHWVQILFLHILPTWISLIMIFTCLLVGVCYILAICIKIILIIDGLITSAKLKRAVIAAYICFIFFTLFFGIMFASISAGAFVAILIAGIVGVGFYTGIMKLADYKNSGKGGSGRGGFGGGSSRSGGSHSSGGGGRSGGGGASGRW